MTGTLERMFHEPVTASATASAAGERRAGQHVHRHKGHIRRSGALTIPDALQFGPVPMYATMASPASRSASAFITSPIIRVCWCWSDGRQV